MNQQVVKASIKAVKPSYTKHSEKKIIVNTLPHV